MFVVLKIHILQVLIHEQQILIHEQQVVVMVIVIIPIIEDDELELVVVLNAHTHLMML